MVTIRPATKAEFALAVEWAANEGWNPGLDDLDAFFPVDPLGFLMGFDGDRPVSSISVVRYGRSFGFLGFYIVAPDMRGTGAGIATWKAGMAHLKGRTVGLDGVVAQQENYRRSGFELAGRNVRFSGKPGALEAKPDGLEIRAVGSRFLAAIGTYDARHFPGARDAFINDWVLPSKPSVSRYSRVAISDGKLVGFGTIRRCRDGWKIGPLQADTPATARSIFDALIALVPDAEPVSLDTPEDNKAAVQLAEAAGLSPVFETARMYRGEPPDLPLQEIFGITTFELG